MLPAAAAASRPTDHTQPSTGWTIALSAKAAIIAVSLVAGLAFRSLVMPVITKALGGRVYLAYTVLAGAAFFYWRYRMQRLRSRLEAFEDPTSHAFGRSHPLPRREPVRPEDLESMRRWGQRTMQEIFANSQEASQFLQTVEDEESHAQWRNKATSDTQHLAVREIWNQMPGLFTCSILKAKSGNPTVGERLEKEIHEKNYATFSDFVNDWPSRLFSPSLFLVPHCDFVRSLVIRFLDDKLEEIMRNEITTSNHEHFRIIIDHRLIPTRALETALDEARRKYQAVLREQPAPSDLDEKLANILKEYRAFLAEI